MESGLSIPICDLHCDTATNLLLGSSLTDTSMQVNLPAMRRGGIGLQVFACYIPPAIPKGSAFAMAEKMILHLKTELGRHPEMALALSLAEVRAAREQGKIAAMIAVENGNAIDADLGNLEKLHHLGVRLMTIIHAESNEWAISSNDPSPAFAGLSDFGRDVIQAMDDLGMIIDVSHSHDRTVEEVLKSSRKPVIASHSCAKTLCPAARNLPDELIAGLAYSGGLIGVNLYPGFLDGTYSEQITATAGDLFTELGKMEREAGSDLVKIGRLFPEFSRNFAAAMGENLLPLERYYDHLLYITEMIGAEYLAFGSDFDGVPILPAGVTDCSSLRTIQQGLLERDYSVDEVEAISWENFLRIVGAVCG
ncbi:MAG TPA: dipeptidase [bacterium]|nr:dipeptidase [bacterium]HQG44758.1 dipeptidase [bacterium]HQI48182.1 dipeptidase [bacterium]HQJ64557.1 dipeptidase [bacterium]